MRNSEFIIGIDPGNTHSAIVAIDKESVVYHWYGENKAFDHALLTIMDTIPDGYTRDVVCEMIASYGMPVGKEIFETCVFIGGILRRFPETQRVTRIQVKSTLCHNSRAKDSNIRQVLMDIYGPPGRKKSKGGTYGLAGDMWAALAVAKAYQDGCEVYKS